MKRRDFITLLGGVESMRPGSVTVNLAVERGGNCETSQAGRDRAESTGSRALGPLSNAPSRIALSASSLYAKNLRAFLEILIDKKTKALAVKWGDEIIKATVLTRDGAVVYSLFKPKSPETGGAT